MSKTNNPTLMRWAAAILLPTLLRPMILLPTLLLLPPCLTSCGVDRWTEYAEETKTDRWIDSIMRSNYYWYEEIPNTNRLNYFQAPAQFFRSLLSPNDRYSSIDSLKTVSRSIADLDYSYGMQYAVYGPMYNDTAYCARIAYVAHDSPADQAGLQRGDWIMEMDGNLITRKNYTRLSAGEAMTLTMGRYDIDNDTVVALDTPVKLGSARAITDNPVYYYKVYERAGKRIGYLVYNRFRSGETDNSGALDLPDRPYDRALLDASNALSADGAGDIFILDLRYNDGGTIPSAELLCTLLAPADALGSNLATLEYNTLIGNKLLTLDPAHIAGGTNLNVHTLYVLTTAQTAAASELLINALKPYMTVILIGQKTAGQYMLTERYANPDLMIRINPVVCRLFNAEGTDGYSTGFIPDYELNEDNYPANYLPFGNENEAMLATALQLIAP